MSEQAEKCAICGEGNLTEGVGARIVSYKGITICVDSHYSECSTCGAIQVSAEQARINKEIKMEFWRSVDSHG